MSGRRLRVVAAILAIGWAISLGVYLISPAVDEDDDDVYELEHSKRHLRDVERLGGKSAVLANDLDEWIASLWRGKTRGYTLACGTVLIAAGYALATRPRPHDS